MSGRSIERAIKKVQNGIGLSDPSEIRRIPDGELLRCPGLGRKTLSIIRSVYPLDENLDEPYVSSTSEEKMLQALMQAQTTEKTNLGRKTSKSLEVINLGSIHNVIAARLNGRVLQIQTPRLWEVVEIGIVWSETGCAEEKQGDLGFGTFASNELIRPSRVFPILKNVTKVDIDEASYHEDFWATTIRIWTNTVVYKIDLFGDDYLDGMVLEDEIDAVKIDDEIRSDAGFNKPFNALFLKWESIHDCISKSKPILALEVLRSANKDILELMSIIDKYAEIRDFSLLNENFVLTGTDSGASENREAAEFLFSWSGFFPNWETPIYLAGKALRHLLEGPLPFQFIQAKEILKEMSSDIMVGLDDFLQRCEVVSNEIEKTQSELQLSGLSGILEKDIVSNIEARHPDDGMVRRAVIRWLNTRALKGQIIKVESRRGIIIRIANP